MNSPVTVPLLTSSSQMLLYSCSSRYSMRAKRIFRDLKENPYIVELDLRGNHLGLMEPESNFNSFI